jgi:hypothetical protein
LRFTGGQRLKNIWDNDQHRLWRDFSSSFFGRAEKSDDHCRGFV